MIQLPAYGKDFNPVRAHKEDCKTPDHCKCPLIYVEKVIMPDARALEWELDRLDPQGPIEEQPMEAGRSQAEITAEGARRLDLFHNSVKILVDLGVPLPQIASPANRNPRVRAI